MSSNTAPRRAALGFIFVTVLLDMLALGVVIPTAPALIMQLSGGTEASAAHFVGLFGTVFALMQFIAMPVLGALSDQVGRRPVVLISNFGLAADYAVMALAPNLAWLFLGRMLSGATSASISTAYAYIADVTAPEKRAGAYGMLGAAFGLGFVIGPALGGLLGGVDPRAPFWAAAALGALNGCYGLLVLPESLPPERRSGFALSKANPLASFGLLRSEPNLTSFAAVKFCNDLAHVVYPATFALYAMYRFNWGVKEVGMTLTAVGVSGVIVQGGLVRRIIARIGEKRALILGLLCGATGFAIYGLAPTPLWFFIGLPFAAFWGLQGPSNQALMTRIVDPMHQGRLQGALGGLTGVAGMLGPITFTSIFALFIGAHAPAHIPGSAFLLASALVLLSLVPALRAVRGEEIAPAAT